MSTDRNPFLSHSTTPNPDTHRSNNTSRLSHETSSPSSGSRNENTSVTANGVPDTLEEELPPAYTSAPDVYNGETTLEFGPTRPFQRPLVPLIPQFTSSSTPSQHTGRQQWPPPEWAGFPGVVPQQSTSGLPVHVPPRRPQLAAPSVPSGSYPTASPIVPSSPSTATSGFARDFYSAGANLNTDLLGGSSSRYTTSPSLRRSSEASPSRHRRTPPPRHPARLNGNVPSQIPDDGTPTNTPVPGHPLLRDGRVLVYPVEFECHKCHNTGYKNYDPSYPHKKCWNKYGKPYAGAITYTAWNSSSSHGSTQFQRPLPSFRPPQSSLRPSGSLHRPSLGSFGTPSNLSRSSSTSRVFSGYPGASASSQSRVIPTPGGGIPMSPYLDPLQQQPYGPPASNSSPAIIAAYGNRPAPGAAVVRPGDPRIGGSLCWRCGGKGTVSFLIFDESTCGVCGGIGRTF